MVAHACNPCTWDGGMIASFKPSWVILARPCLEIHELNKNKESNTCKNTSNLQMSVNQQQLTM
jgi:hypothetical protein